MQRGCARLAAAFLGHRIGVFSWEQWYQRIIGYTISPQLCTVYPLSLFEGGYPGQSFGGIFVLDKQIAIEVCWLATIATITTSTSCGRDRFPKRCQPGASEMGLRVWLQEAGVESRKMELLPSGSLHPRFQITKCRLQFYCFKSGRLTNLLHHCIGWKHALLGIQVMLFQNHHQKAGW